MVLEANVRQLTAEEVAVWAKSDAPPVLLDVREDWERERAAIVGAHEVPLSRFTQALEALQLSRDAKVVTFCHHGVRSLRAGQAMLDAGYQEVTSMAGGIDAWACNVDAKVGRY